MQTNLLYLIPALPLAAFTINILFGRTVRPAAAAMISIGASLISTLIAIPLIIMVAKGYVYADSFAWLTVAGHSMNFGYLLDPLGAMLLFVVTIVGTLIQIYSVGYMNGDPHYSRFFAYLSLFMFAMLALVISNNYLLFFMAWEVMGLCSYLLIGFWSEKPSAANAGLKAFLTTRVGDVGFLLGILTLFVATGTLGFQELHHLGEGQHLSPFLPLAALLIFCGTIGKSAQFPLHVWLPDAMEGPTPVSALIHAATMVAAGVYLVARSFDLFLAVPDVLPVVATIGTLTAFMAAFIALTANDIKKVLAYSTISQLGYMIAALGVGGFSAGTFHLMTHAFFKALLFLGAGSVIHGTGTQDIREMGGLFGKMKSTATTFLIASLAIAGVPPLAGFWSKDEILVVAFEGGSPWIYWILLITSFMTAFYMFRLVFLTFFGKPRNHEVHAHESPAIMTAPLWVLAIGSAIIGIPGSPWMKNWFQHFIHGGQGAAEHHINWFVLHSSIIVGFGGILLAAVMYLWVPALAEAMGRIFRPLYNASINKLWFDELYSVIIIRPFHWIGRLSYRFDANVIDWLVNATGLSTLKGSDLQNWIDTYIVDGAVNAVGAITRFFSAVLRRMQTGLIQNYLLIVFAGVIVLMFFELR